MSAPPSNGGGFRRDGFRQSLNEFLDSLPRPRVGRPGKEAPTFRTCGIVGFYVALIVLFGAGLLTGRSLSVLTTLGLVSGLSFFAYTYLRKWITGHEELVLLEHVWFALACNALALWGLGQPVLPYLDLVSLALCPFLAAGRVGCTLVGCCHGNPSSVGIAYNEACARDGFPSHLVGVRLFPVQAIEALGLLFIGATGLAALPFATPGKVFTWYLLSYSVMRFGLEGIRGDDRPHFLGISQARWMSIAEVVVAVWLVGKKPSEIPWLALGSSAVALFGALTLRWRRDPRKRMLAPAHVHEIRGLVRARIESDRTPATARIMAHKTSQGLSIAVSASPLTFPRVAHVSLACPGLQGDLPLLCELAAGAFPMLIPHGATFTSRQVLHLTVPMPLEGGNDGAGKPPISSRVLYGAVVRRFQRGAPSAADEALPPEPLPPEANVQGQGNENSHDPAAPWYFADLRHRAP